MYHTFKVDKAERRDDKKKKKKSINEEKSEEPGPKGEVSSILK